MGDAGTVMRWGRVIGAFVLALALIAVVQVGHATSAPPDVAISIQSFAFVGPNNTNITTVPVGTKVIWTNNDPFNHTTTSDAAVPVWDSGFLAHNATFTFTFTAVGTFTYHCNIHASMHGTIIVTAAPTVTSLAPASGPTTGGTAVTISGADFQNGATVTFGGVAATGVAFVTSGALTAVTPAHVAEVVDVVVTNPDTGVGTGAGVYTYVVAPLPPQKPQGAPILSNPAPAPAPHPQAPPDPGGPPAALPTHR